MIYCNCGYYKKIISWEFYNTNWTRFDEKIGGRIKKTRILALSQKIAM